MSLDPNKTYLVWNGTEFPNSTSANFKAPARSTIDWGDGKGEEFSTETAAMHTYDDGKTEHTIAISGLTSIDQSAFYGCSSLTSVTISNRVTIIRQTAFYACSSLTSATIGNSVTSIGNYAFGGCSKLTNITIPNSVTSIGNSAFGGCSKLTSVAIPNSVTSISNGLFNNCSKLTSITIGNSVTSIGNSAFFGCSSLTSIKIPDSVTSIGNNAFFGCSSLTSIKIPDSVTSIGNNAFAYCIKLRQLILFKLTPPTLGSGAIPDNIQLIYVQQSSKAAYQTATNWAAFATKIVGDNLYLSFVRFNQKNKEYIDGKVDEVKQYIDNKIAELISNKV